MFVSLLLLLLFFSSASRCDDVDNASVIGRAGPEVVQSFRSIAFDLGFFSEPFKGGAWIGTSCRGMNGSMGHESCRTPGSGGLLAEAYRLSRHIPAFTIVHVRSSEPTR